MREALLFGPGVSGLSLQPWTLQKWGDFVSSDLDDNQASCEKPRVDVGVQGASQGEVMAAADRDHCGAASGEPCGAASQG